MGLSYEEFISILYLFSFCQMGVVCRIYIGKLFGGACTPGYDGAWAWIPCVTSPVSFLSNIGCTVTDHVTDHVMDHVTDHVTAYQTQTS